MKKTTTLFASLVSSHSHSRIRPRSAAGALSALPQRPHRLHYLGDIWTADENGQNVQRLTVNRRAMFMDVSRPTGSGLLSRARETGNLDVYLMPSNGGNA
jgi:tricorn protease